MKCIDAIEGTVKCILEKMHADHIQNESDDSEYIRTVKTVIDATDAYMENNPECIDRPELLKQVLYAYSRNLWLVGQKSAENDPLLKKGAFGSDADEYETYYYDYLYDRGIYPN